MSVSYYACRMCGTSVYEEYFGYCNNCNKGLCTDCLINNDLESEYSYEYGYRMDSQNIELMKKYEKEGYELYKEKGQPHYKNGEIIDDSGIDSNFCPFCSGESYTDDDLLEYLLSTLKLNKEAVAKEFLESKK